MLQDFQSINTMGVINITPNSFSDPHKFLNRDQLLKTLIHLKDRSDIVLDFGFESTAPMNDSITAIEEKNRFDQFFSEIKDVDLSNRWISFDTYKIQNYSYFEEQFKCRYKNNGFIFNDVSGVIDSELINFLKEKKLDKNFYYLHSNTHIPSRDLVLKHMKYINVEGDIISDTIDKFLEAITQFESIGILDKIILDPCFGFSKSYEQNWHLLKNIEKVISEIKSRKFIGPWLIGISKKSFLRKSLPALKNSFLDSEILHLEMIKKIIQKNLGQTIFRTHDFDIVQTAKKDLES